MLGYVVCTLAFAEYGQRRAGLHHLRRYIGARGKLYVDELACALYRLLSPQKRSRALDDDAGLRRLIVFIVVLVRSREHRIAERYRDRRRAVADRERVAQTKRRHAAEVDVTAVTVAPLELERFAVEGDGVFVRFRLRAELEVAVEVYLDVAFVYAARVCGVYLVPALVGQKLDGADGVFLCVLVLIYARHSLYEIVGGAAFFAAERAVVVCFVELAECRKRLYIADAPVHHLVKVRALLENDEVAGGERAAFFVVQAHLDSLCAVVDQVVRSSVKLHVYYVHIASVLHNL